MSSRYRQLLEPRFLLRLALCLAVATTAMHTARAASLDLAIDEYRLRRVAAAAELLASRFAGPRDDIRIDVVLIAPRCWPRHLANVWHG